MRDRTVKLSCRSMWIQINRREPKRARAQKMAGGWRGGFQRPPIVAAVRVCRGRNPDGGRTSIQRVPEPFAPNYRDDSILKLFTKSFHGISTRNIEEKLLHRRRTGLDSAPEDSKSYGISAIRWYRTQSFGLCLGCMTFGRRLTKLPREKFSIGSSRSAAIFSTPPMFMRRARRRRFSGRFVGEQRKEKSS